MTGESVQSKSFNDLPPEIIVEIVMRMSGSDIHSLAETSVYIRNAVYANITWIRRCKREFDIEVDPSKAEEAGEGSVCSFYLQILQPFGPFLGPLKITNVKKHYGGMFQLVHDGGLGLTCYEWVPPTVMKGVQNPMSLLKCCSVTVAKEAEGNHPNFETFDTIYDLVIMKVDQNKCLLQTNSHIYKKDFGITRLKELVLSEPDRELLAEWKKRENYDEDDDDFHRYHLQPAFSMLPEAKLSSPVPIPPGLFKGEYNEMGSQCTELVHLSYHEDAGGITFIGRKVTGDIHVPAEKISFKGNLDDCLQMTLHEQVRASEKS